MTLSDMFRGPAVTTERINKDLPVDSISRSYFLMRLIIGILGIALPIILVVGDWVLLNSDKDEILARGSLSAYYHSSMRDAFVIVMAMTGMLLFTYKFSEITYENVLSMIAGVAAICVAIFPTKTPKDGSATPTGVQNALTEGLSSGIHYSAAIAFVVALGIICLGFYQRDKKASRDTSIGDSDRNSYRLWANFHAFAASVIALSLVYIAITQTLKVGDSHSILYGETIIAFAFGASWFQKGASTKLMPKATKDGTYI